MPLEHKKVHRHGMGFRQLPAVAAMFGPETLATGTSVVVVVWASDMYVLT